MNQSQVSDFQFEGQYALLEMVRRAVTNARPRRFGTAPRWAAVRDTLAYGSTTSTLLCLHFGLDPDEEVEGWPQVSDASEEDYKAFDF